MVYLAPATDAEWARGSDYALSASDADCLGVWASEEACRAGRLTHSRGAAARVHRASLRGLGRWPSCAQQVDRRQ